MPKFSEIISAFECNGKYLNAVPFGNGHIHDTYLVQCDGDNDQPTQYILQRINHYVFKQPEQVIENILLVTEHLKQKAQAAGDDPHRSVVRLIPTRTGQPYLKTQNGDYWRAQHMIAGASSYDSSENLKLYYHAAHAFGKYLRRLSDLDPARLHATIPDFHNTPKRLTALRNAIAQDTHQRVAQVRAEIDFIEQRAAETSLLLDLHANGQLPERVTHNDTKLNNVMIDEDTMEGVCVIDLDTTMPGLSLYDFGDAVRSATLTGPEDAQNEADIGFNLAIFEQLAHGYLDATRGLLTAVEIEWLAFSGRLITLENGIRFLTDYLMGDVYFKVQRPEHNLERCRTQLKLVSKMERQYAQMTAIVTKYA